MAINTAKSLESRVSNGEDPGAVDNRLSLDPNNPEWKDTIADWQDGEEYEVKATIRQISPGEYEVTSVESESAPEAESPEEDSAEGAEEPDEMPMKGMPNKAVRKMMLQEGA